MKQKVNLCTALPKKVMIRLALNRMLQIVGVLIVCLMVLYGFDYMKQAGFKGELTALQTKNGAIRKQLVTINKRLPKKNKKGKRLVVSSPQVLTLEEEVKLKQQIVNNLTQTSLSNQKGFSSYFLHLSQQIVSGIWLSDISLKQGGAYLVLNGNAFDTNTVLQFLGKLNHDEVFKDLRIKLASLSKPKAQQKGEEKTLSFVFRSKLEGAK